MASFSFKLLLRVWKSNALPPEDLPRFYGTDLAPYSMEPLAEGELPSFGRSAILEIASLGLSDFGERRVSEEERETYETGINHAFNNLAAWLPRLSADLVRNHQGNGWQFDVAFFYYLEEGNQMLDITLPPALMAELGRLNFHLNIYTDGFG